MANAVKSFIADFGTSESGATAVEYGFLVATISLALIVALQNTGSSLISLWTTVSSDVNQANAGNTSG